MALEARLTAIEERLNELEAAMGIVSRVVQRIVRESKDPGPTQYTVPWPEPKD